MGQIEVPRLATQFSPLLIRFDHGLREGVCRVCYNYGLGARRPYQATERGLRCDDWFPGGKRFDTFD
jgi:hypothetical protein